MDKLILVFVLAGFCIPVGLFIAAIYSLVTGSPLYALAFLAFAVVAALIANQ